jgi:hypothetical protein
MAVTKLTCPDCGNVMRPAKPLPAGKKIKCSECGGMFAAGDNDKPAAAVTKMAGKSGDKKTEMAGKSEKKKTEMAGKSEKKTEFQAKAPAGKKTKKADDEPAKPQDDRIIPLADDDDDGGPATYDYLHEGKHEEPEVDHVPDTTIKDLRGPAQAKIIRPSNSLLLCSILGFFAYLIIAVIFLIPVCFPVPQVRGPDGAAAPAAQQKKEEKPVSSLFMVFAWDLMDTPTYPWWAVFLLVSSCFLGMIWCGIVTYGAVKMQTLESRTWGIVSSIMAMIPCTTLAIFGLVSIVFTDVIGLIFDEKTVYFLGPFWGLATFGSNIAIGAWNLTTMLSEDVIAGYEYVSDA